MELFKGNKKRIDDIERYKRDLSDGRREYTKYTKEWGSVKFHPYSYLYNEVLKKRNRAIQKMEVAKSNLKRLGVSNY